MDPLGAANVTIEGTTFKGHACPGVSDKLMGCNDRGLTAALGPFLLNKLMDKGMLIDVDHMSAKSLDETFVLARAHGNYPLMVGHGLFNEPYAVGKNRHERMRTKEQLETLKQLGSLVSVMTQDEMTTQQAACVHSSVSFAINYNYAVGKMGTVAFGSDFNGMAGHVGPRFGDDACGGEATQKRAQQLRLGYPFRLAGFGVFEKQVTGQRTFDFNVDGFAHIGLYPDLLADLELQGVSIEPLMRSAGAYVTAWRKGLQAKANASPEAPSQKAPPTKNLKP
jgi:microsomal dipeptidase-like Zn-dependent dipeptidase